jgi:hypothetical protein
MTPDSLVAALQQLQQQWKTKANTLKEEAKTCKRLKSAPTWRIEELWVRADILESHAAELGTLITKASEDTPTADLCDVCERPLPPGPSTECPYCHTKWAEPYPGKAAPPLGADALKDECTCNPVLGTERCPIHGEPQFDLPAPAQAFQDGKNDPLTTDDPRVVSVMGSVPECAANGCQFRKTSGYRPGEQPDFPSSAAPQAPAGWQDIATAPKDRQSLILWSDGRYSIGRPLFSPVHASGPGMAEIIEAVKWMPLPASPLPAPAPETP